MNVNELPKEVKAWALDRVLGNEVGSDEYRETQPTNGLNIASCFPFSSMTPYGDHKGLNENDLGMLTAVRDWLTAIITETATERQNDGWEAYAGCDALNDVIIRYFDAQWDSGVNPFPTYWETAEDIKQAYDEDRERQSAMPAEVIALYGNVILVRDSFNEVRSIRRGLLPTEIGLGDTVDLKKVDSEPTNQLGSIIGE